MRSRNSSHGYGFVVSVAIISKQNNHSAGWLRLPRLSAINTEVSMKLQELKEVKDALKLPIVSCTNRLRWEECDDADDRAQMVWQLATAVMVEADLKDHISALTCILEICEAVAKGRYLEDCQRCNWAHHRCDPTLTPAGTFSQMSGEVVC
jgi:hypothetical protein